jgi:hypothetical protein
MRNLNINHRVHRGEISPLCPLNAENAVAKNINNFTGILRD